MKLRRALTSVAATAVIAPAALLAAPAAQATGSDTAATASAEPTPAAPGPEQGADATPSAEPTAADGEDASGDETAPAENTGPTAGSGGSGGSATPTAPASTAKPGPTASGTPTTAPGSPSPSPSDDGDCTLDDAALDVSVAGLPSKLVAGADWSRFSVKLRNTTDKKLEEVYPFILAVSLEDDDTRTESPLHLEYQDPDTGKWTTFGEWSDGDYFGWFELDAHQTAELTLRIRADKTAKPGDGFALIAGDYFNGDGSCGTSKENWYDFAILPAGSKPGEVPPAKPGKPGNKPGPQGTAKPVATGKPKEGLDKLPVTGNLAETGASSALPTIGLVGGVAMAVGAGAIFVVRRRKATGGIAA
ncbi:LPXTG cell wall anchor domain-containing protein [Streptomyces albulus]|uniref:LAETG motif-containing sortase-dependent surface protein n=1 Tax=Streptomyces TaxID=1883 RepID=UPI001F3AC0BD|nr:LAETG motif-containing sortase-dependent surface protein [Streptomyces noursei]MCE4947443.1 LPXTG cell wall anchor domain-containing protein [Streptomyces noursei]